MISILNHDIIDELFKYIIGKTDSAYFETGLVKIFFDINKMNY